MFRHNGRRRTYLHNLRLASLLSAVAGIVNSAGLLALDTLTTNVTGHFAFFSEQLFLRNYNKALVFLSYTVVFLIGAFMSSLLMEVTSSKKKYSSYRASILLEIGLLCFTACSGLIKEQTGQIILPCILLLTMGLQNALVTRVSQSVVRTTHLTGLFTDLGIELSQLIFRRDMLSRQKIYHSIYLKSAVIGGFFTGALLGGFLFFYLGIYTLLLPALLLFFALWYDLLTLKYYRIKRKSKIDFK